MKLIVDSRLICVCMYVLLFCVYFIARVSTAVRVHVCESSLALHHDNVFNILQLD